MMEELAKTTATDSYNMSTLSLPSASNMSGQQCHTSQGNMPGEEGTGGVVMVKKKRGKRQKRRVV